MKTMQRLVWCAGVALVAVSLVGAPAWAQGGAGQARRAEAAAAIAPGVHGDLSEEQRAIFEGSAEDPPAEKLLGVNEEYEGRSYLAGDEWNLHLYQEHIDGLGGGYVGVGADQAYLLMSWSKPEFAWLIDYDPMVVKTHKLYEAFFLHAKTPEEFLALWDRDHAKEAKALLAKYWEGDEDEARVQKIYDAWRRRIRRRLRRVANTLEEAEVPSYLDDQGRYDYVRGMLASGRVRPMLANLLEDEGMVGIGKAARELGVPIRVLYLSNAQEYWAYPDQFRANIAALPFDERSRVLHTLSTWSTNKDYRYVLQPGQNFAAWMTHDWVRKVYYMIPRRELEGPEDIDFIEFERDVEEATERYQRRRKRRRARKKEREGQKK